MAAKIETRPRLASLADERYVSITTFRRDGSPASTPVWVVSDDPHRLLVAQGSGHVEGSTHQARPARASHRLQRARQGARRGGGQARPAVGEVLRRCTPGGTGAGR